MSFVFDRASVDAKMRLDLTAAFTSNNANLDNLQLLEVSFPTDYTDIITSTQEETIKITEAQNNQAQKQKEWEGLVTKGTQDQTTIANNAQAFATESKTKYDTFTNEYTYYLPNMVATWNSMKAQYGDSTPQYLLLEWFHTYNIGRYVPTTPGEISAMFQT